MADLLVVIDEFDLLQGLLDRRLGHQVLVQVLRFHLDRVT
jgi:hypothetical protein